MDMDIRKVAKVLFCISQNKSDEDIIKMMKIGNIKADDNDTNPLGIGHTPLHVAAMRGRTDLTRIFLSTTKVNININVNNRMQPFPRSPIVCALSYDHIDVVRVLLEHGAVVNDEGFNVLLRCSISSELKWMITKEVARTGTRRKDGPWTDTPNEHKLFTIAAAVPAAGQLFEQEFSQVRTRNRLWREAVAMQRNAICLAGSIKESEEYDPWLKWVPPPPSNTTGKRKLCLLQYLNE